MAKKKTTKPTKTKPKGATSKATGPTPISDALREAIKTTGPGTAYHVSKLSGVSLDPIARFLRGERDLRLETADKLAAALGLKLVRTDLAPPPAE